MYYIFDLDNTVIDSSHRQTFVNGKLDLDAWKRDNTKKEYPQRFVVAYR